MDQKGGQISIDGDMIMYHSNADQDFYNYIYQKDNQLTYSDLVQLRLPFDIQIFTFKSDINKTINGIEFESGIKTAYTNTDNIAEYFTAVDSNKILNTDLSNHFIYQEWIQSAYINFSKKLYGFDCQLGLCAEHTTLHGDQKGNSVKAPKEFSKGYTKLFPTFFVSRNLDSAGVHVLNFSYGRRIDRPIFQHLNPFVSPLDKYTFYVGNPDLVPTFSNNFSLTHSYKNKINASVNFSKTINGINETLEIIGDIYYSRPLNVTTNYSTSVSIDANHTFNKWLTIIPYLEFGNVKYKSKLYTEELNSEGNYLRATLTQSFKLKSNWSVEIKGDYQSDLVYSQLLLKSYGIVGCTIQKKFAKGNATARIGVNDIFYTRRASGTINNLKNTDAYWNSTLDTRSLVLNLTYRFGKSNIQKQQYKATGAESEKRRIQS
ncbi:MAG TPA: outer membrane beta-barrel family protein [Saprospiraceae bacterium]|nr:outer membrane beta-barrel family protein [Saprospiraceae bacterium]